ncbi:ParB/RepB/Spo0J family partition protein [bacterium]|nr:ParB/RepB/Spo0J family partition protein [bacterium]
MTQPARPQRLGRGLSALLGDYAATGQGDEPNAEIGPAATIALDQVAPNPKQPRRTFDQAELAELADSIRAKGVIQAILVRPDPQREGRYEIIAGERRWRAARLAGLTEIPAIVRDMDDLESLEVAIVENVQRADLNAVEEAEAYRALMSRFGRTQENVAAQVGKSREHVANTLRLLNLPDDVREHVRLGRLSAGHARALLSAPDPAAAAAIVIQKGLTVRDTEALVRKAKEQGSAPSETPYAPLEKDVDTKALEADLQRALGLGVDIRYKPNAGGEMRIRYARLEQLDELCRLLTRGRSAG